MVAEEIRQWVAGWTKNLFFGRSEHQRVSAGVASHNLPIVLNHEGRIDGSFLEGVTIDGDASSGNSFKVTRNLPAASTDAAVVLIEQQHAGDDQAALAVTQAGTGDILQLWGPAAALHLRVEADGDVAIGTSLPRTKLGVAGDISIINQVPNNTTLGTLGFYHNPGIGNIAYIRGSTASAEYAGELSFGVRQGGTAYEAMRIRYNGNVGIGTATPYSLLHIQESVVAGADANASDHLVVESNVGSVYINVIANPANNAGILFSDDNRAAGYIAYSHATNAMNFYVNGGAHAMQIDSTGAVGIGTTDPVQQLHVYEAAATATILVETGAAQVAGIRYTTPSGTTYMGNTGVAGSTLSGTGAADFAISARAGGAIRISADVGFAASEGINLLETGRVGIGLVAPQGRLHVKDGAGNHVFVTLTALVGTLTTAVSGITRVALLSYLCYHSAGTPDGNAIILIQLGGAARTLFNDGAGNIVLLTLTSGGLLQVQRTGGSLSYTVVLDVIYA